MVVISPNKCDSNVLTVAAKFSKLSAKFIQYRPEREWRRMLKFEFLDSHFSTEEGLY